MNGLVGGTAMAISLAALGTSLKCAVDCRRYRRRAEQSAARAEAAANRIALRWTTPAEEPEPDTTGR